MEASALNQLLSGINKSLSHLDRKIDDVDAKLDDVRLSYVRKDEYQADKAIRRAILMWGLGIVVTVAIATWTIVASRPDLIMP